MFYSVSSSLVCFTAVTVDMIFVSIVLQATKVIAAVIASVTVIVIVIASISISIRVSIRISTREYYES